MSVMDRILDGITKAIRIEGRVEQLALQSMDQQRRIENLTERVIRLETALEIGLSVRNRQLLAQSKDK